MLELVNGSSIKVDAPGGLG